MVSFSIPERQGFKAHPIDRAAQARLGEELKRCDDCVSRPGQYEDPRDFLGLPLDKEYQERIVAHAERIRAMKPLMILFVGIGGSLLGPKALYQAFKDSFLESEQLVAFFDTIDPDALADFGDFVKECAPQGAHVVIVSKSGTTLETSVNAAALMGFFEKFGSPLSAQQVSIITDHGSPLWHLAQQAGYHILEIPRPVGGRYSVFSAVGQLLFSFCFPRHGASLLAGAQAALVEGTRGGEKNSALTSAQFLYSAYHSGCLVHDTFIFCSEYELVGKWYRQLLGESLGKRFNKDGKRVETGLLPTVSIGTSDLHSMAQYYFGGPRIIVSSLVFIEPLIGELIVPSNEQFSQLKGGTSVTHMVRGIFDGVVRTYEKESRPVMVWSLAHTPYDLAYFMQMKMLEIVYLAALFEVDAFDQPEVELYKQEVRHLLA